MFNETTQLATSAFLKSNPLTFITGLKYDANVVKALNNLTFLYDPNWEYEPMNPTYPLAFFYVQKQSEDMSSEISQRPMLFYNSENKGKDSVKAGLMNIIADNIIIKPKVYKLDVLIPMNMDSFFSGGYFNENNVVNANAFIINGSQGNKTLSKLNYGTQAMAVLRTLITALYGAELNVNSFFTMLTRQQDYNKNSIEYMWRNRRILKLKMWNSWQFKYLAILSFDVSKVGENGDFFEGTLTCQEVPVLTIKSRSSKVKTTMSSISALLGNKMKQSAEIFVNTMEPAGGN